MRFLTNKEGFKSHCARCGVRPWEVAVLPAGRMMEEWKPAFVCRACVQEGERVTESEREGKPCAT